jgi:hypothetical protein
MLAAFQMGSVPACPYDLQMQGQRVMAKLNQNELFCVRIPSNLSNIEQLPEAPLQ